MRKDLFRSILLALESQSLTFAELKATLGQPKYKISYAMKNLHELTIIEKFLLEDSSNLFRYAIHPDIKDLYLKWPKE